jgi:LmbE family N-acetylglucosaminyl deacetylase
MAKTILAIGAHYDDCVFGIPGILLQAVRKHYRVVILSLIGDYSNWSPVKGREKDLRDGTVQISKEYGAEMRYLQYASHRFDVTLESKRAVAEVVSEVQPEIAFMMWPHDHHHDHEVAATLSKIALPHGDRLLEKGAFTAPKFVYAYDNGPRHTIGFQPNVFVDVTPDWQTAQDWLGRFMALVRNQPYDRKIADGALRAKESLARYRGQTCGVQYAEAVWATAARPQDIL